MSTGSILPPDIREQMSSRPAHGIGGGSVKAEAPPHQRSTAKEPEDPSIVGEASLPALDDDVVRTDCPNPSCRAQVESAWSYCPRCSCDLMRDGADGRLGISFTEDDLSDYLFKGYISRDVKVLGKHHATMKSSQPKDLEAIDSYLMNGDWAKNEDGSDRKISEFYMRQMNMLCITAASVIKVDGESIGDTLDARMRWLMERGSAFVDMLSAKVSLFNQGLTEYLKKEDTVLGS